MLRAARSGAKSSVGPKFQWLRMMRVGKPVVLGRVMPTPFTSTASSSPAPMAAARSSGILSRQPPSMYFTPSISRGRSAGKQALDPSR